MANSSKKKKLLDLTNSSLTKLYKCPHILYILFSEIENSLRKKDPLSLRWFLFSQETTFARCCVTIDLIVYNYKRVPSYHEFRKRILMLISYWSVYLSGIILRESGSLNFIFHLSAIFDFLFSIIFMTLL